MLLALLPLTLLTLPSCKSPEELGFDAGAKYISIFVAVGADTMGMPCPERLAMATEFYDKGKAGRAELEPKVKDAREKDGFKKGLDRITEVRPRVFSTFARECPAEAQEFAEMMKKAESELGIVGMLPELEATAP